MIPAAALSMRTLATDARLVMAATVGLEVDNLTSDALTRTQMTAIRESLTRLIDVLSLAWSRNPLERLNKEIKRRTNVVGTFPNPEALLRLTGHVLIEQHDEWDSVDRRYFSENSMKLITQPLEGVVLAGLEAA